jgi:membrane protease YdiL (CAAX protease family)
VLVCVFLGSVVALVLRYPAEGMQHPLTFGLVLLASGGSLLGALWMVANPWPADRLKARSFVFVSLVYGGILLSAAARKLAGSPAPASDALQLAITTLSFQGAVLILAGRLVHEHGLGWSQAFGFRNHPLRAAVVGFMCAFSIIPVAWGLQFISAKVMTALHWHPTLQHAVDIFNLTQTWSDRVVLGLVALILAPIAEEIMFRGIMYPALKGFGLPRFAFWATAIVFALIHFNAATLLPLLAFACLLNVLYERTGNLVTCMVAHASFNAINLAMLVANRHFLA